MLKHLYCAPTIKVATVETEDIIGWSAHEATGNGNQLTGYPIGNKEDITSTDADSESGEGEGAKGFSFDFE